MHERCEQRRRALAVDGQAAIVDLYLELGLTQPRSQSARVLPQALERGPDWFEQQPLHRVRAFSGWQASFELLRQGPQSRA